MHEDRYAFNSVLYNSLHGEKITQLTCYNYMNYSPFKINRFISLIIINLLHKKKLLHLIFTVKSPIPGGLQFWVTCIRLLYSPKYLTFSRLVWKLQIFRTNADKKKNMHKHARLAISWFSLRISGLLFDAFAWIFSSRSIMFSKII